MKYKDYHKGLVKEYMEYIFLKIIKFGNISRGDKILDFGGGYGHFKKRLEQFGNEFFYKTHITVYDIVPELSEIKDYTSWRGDIILCCHVLEHIPKKDLEIIIKNFKKINPHKLIVALPTENIFSKIGVWITNLKKTYEDIPHQLNYKEVNQLIEKHFTLKKRKYVCFKMTQISIYEDGN